MSHTPIWTIRHLLTAPWLSSRLAIYVCTDHSRGDGVQYTPRSSCDSMSAASRILIEICVDLHVNVHVFIQRLHGLGPANFSMNWSGQIAYFTTVARFSNGRQASLGPAYGPCEPKILTSEMSHHRDVDCDQRAISHKGRGAQPPLQPMESYISRRTDFLEEFCHKYHCCKMNNWRNSWSARQRYVDSMLLGMLGKGWAY